MLLLLDKLLISYFKLIHRAFRLVPLAVSRKDPETKGTATIIQRVRTSIDGQNPVIAIPARLD